MKPPKLQYIIQDVAIKVKQNEKQCKNNQMRRNDKLKEKKNMKQNIKNKIKIKIIKSKDRIIKSETIECETDR